MKRSYTGAPLSERHSKMFASVSSFPEKRFGRRFSFRPSESPLFKRTLVKRSEIKNLTFRVEELIREIIQDHGTAGVRKIRSFIYEFDYKGVPVIIKDVGQGNLHGSDPELLRRDFLVHQRMARAGVIDTTKYILISPKVYIKIGRFLVMERVNELPLESMTGLELVSFFAARSALESNLNYLFNKSFLPSGRPPQADSHLMPIGQKNDRWVFCLPYDYA